MKKGMCKKLKAFFLAVAVLITALPQNSLAAEDGEICLLTVRYVEDGESVAPDYSATLRAGSRYSVESPEIEGYTADKESASGVLDKDTLITVNYEENGGNAGYVINYIGRGVEGEETLLDTVQDEARINTIVGAEDKIFSGYVREPGRMELTVTADGKAALNIYYIETVNPCIIFNTGGSYVAPVSAAPGSDISDQIAEVTDPENAPVLKGYVFDKWDRELPDTMPEEDLIINAVWKPGTSEYTVVYWLQYADGSGYQKLEGEDVTREAQTDSKVNIIETDKKKDKADDGLADCDMTSSFWGYDFGHADQDVTVTSDGRAVLNVYYDREIWKVIMYNEPYDASGNTEYTVWKELSGRYGSMIPEEELNYDMAKEYYEGRYPEKGYFYNCVIGKSQYVYPTSFTGTIGLGPEEDKRDHVGRSYPGMTTNEPFVYEEEYYRESLENEGEYECYKTNKVVHQAQTFSNGSRGSGIGFTWAGGWWKNGETKEEALASEKLPVYANRASRPLNQEIITVPASNQVGYIWIYETDTSVKRWEKWMMFYSNRVRSDVIYMSDGEVCKTEGDVPYERQVDLSVIPDNDDSGRVFRGWYLMPELEGDPLSEYTMPPNDLILYAKWEDAPCTVTFDTRGGSAVDSQSVEKNGKAVSPENPTRENYTFAGWYDEDGIRWSFDREITQDTTLYAWWIPEVKPVEYTVHHRISGEEKDFYTDTGKGLAGDSVAVRPLERDEKDYPAGAYPEELSSRSILLTEGKNEAVFYYQKPQPVNYAVHYYKQDTEESVLPDKTVTDVYLAFATEKAPAVKGYEIIGELYAGADLAAGENEITFYYIEKADENQSAGSTEPGSTSPGTDKNTGKNQEVPQTGDDTDSRVWIWVCLISAGCVATIAAEEKRKQKNKK